MTTIVIAVTVSVVVALLVLAFAVLATPAGGAMVRDVRAARAGRRQAGARPPRQILANARRELADAADAEDGLDELLTWTTTDEDYLTVGELGQNLRGAALR